MWPAPAESAGGATTRGRSLSAEVAPGARENGPAWCVLTQGRLRSARLCTLIVGLTGCMANGPSQRIERVRVGDTTFGVRYFAEDAEAARQVERVLQRAVLAAARWGELSVPVLITIHPTHRDLEAAAHRGGLAWLRAWARYASVDLQSPRTWSSGSASDAQMTALLSHELTHCVMNQSAGSERAWSSRAIPLWFREGMASVAAGQEYGWVSPEAIRRLYLEKGPSGGSEPLVEDPLTAPGSLFRSNSDLVYATASRAFHFLLDRYGEEPIRRVMAGMSDGKGFGEAFRHALGVPVEGFEGDFRNHILCLSPSTAEPSAAARIHGVRQITASWARHRPIPQPPPQEAGATR